jgi:hypothetical protein
MLYYYYRRLLTHLILELSSVRRIVSSSILIKLKSLVNFAARIILVDSLRYRVILDKI